MLPNPKITTNIDNAHRREQAESDVGERADLGRPDPFNNLSGHRPAAAPTPPDSWGGHRAVKMSPSPNNWSGHRKI